LNIKKIVFSFFIVFHLLVLLILSNNSSFLSRLYGDYLAPYANMLALNTTWNFFSPDPAHTMYFKYVAYFENENGETTKEPIEEYIPNTKNEVVLQSSRRRVLYYMRYMILDTQRIEKVLSKWLCRKNPGATRVYIEHIIEQIPPLDRVLIDKEDPVSRTKFSGSEAPMKHSFNCG